jgi:3D (Asp-Asp-Asp) domain-containing protein
MGGALLVGMGLTSLLNGESVNADSSNGRPETSKSVQNPAEIDMVKDGTEAAKTVVRNEPIPYPTLRKSTTELRSGTSKTVRAGINGSKQVKYRVLTKDGEEVDRQVLSSKVLKNPVPEVVKVGQAKRFASRGGYYSGRRVITMTATGYSPHPSENGGNTSGRTAIGLKIGHGVVAVDPRFIPLGTRLYVEGYGYAVAADTGGAIKGAKIDLGHDTMAKARAVGRKKVRVHILD